MPVLTSYLCKNIPDPFSREKIPQWFLLFMSKKSILTRIGYVDIHFYNDKIQLMEISKDSNYQKKLNSIIRRMSSLSGGTGKITNEEVLKIIKNYP